MDEAALRSWIREHRVRWELGPRLEFWQGHTLQIGFNLTLLARHPHLADDAVLGCWQTLREIVERVLPQQAQRTAFEIDPFEDSIHLSASTQWEPEVELRLGLTHRESPFAGIDDEQRQWVAEIQAGLRRLGVTPGGSAAGESLSSPA